MIIWITGLAGAGKTTIATAVYHEIKNIYPNTVFLDGDILREVLGVYGYSYDERYIQAEKIHNLCKMLDNQDINVVCATIGSFHRIQERNRASFNKYCEIYIEVTMENLIKRDKKGLYSRALIGETINVVGVDIKPEVPKNPELIVDNNTLDCLEHKVMDILNYLRDNQYIL